MRGKRQHCTGKNFLKRVFDCFLKLLSNKFCSLAKLQQKLSHSLGFLYLVSQFFRWSCGMVLAALCFFLKRRMVLNNAIKPQALSEKEAAVYIGISVSYLQKDRMNGALPERTKGPRYAKIGKRVVYLREELDYWLERYLQ